VRVALGFVPHSGWAAAVGVVLEGDRVRVVARERVELANDPEAKQPYHALEGVPLPDAEPRLRAFERDAGDRAGAGLTRLLDGLARDGHDVAVIGILDSSGRKGTALAEILSSHALIHTADGDHFRAAIAAAAERRGLAVVRVKARGLEDEAARAIGRARETLAREVQELGRALGPPWGADQKAAALLAWRCLPR
jgi:hypothetical protein